MVTSASSHNFGALIFSTNLFNYNIVYIHSAKLLFFRITAKEIPLFLLINTKIATIFLIYIIFQT